MKQCNGKNCYESEREARRVRNLRERLVQKLRVYQCDLCHYWHLTSEEKHEKYPRRRTLRDDDAAWG